VSHSVYSQFVYLMVELFLQAQEVSLFAAVETHLTVSSLRKRHGIKNFSVL